MFYALLCYVYQRMDDKVDIIEHLSQKYRHDNLEGQEQKIIIRFRRTIIIHSILFTLYTYNG